MRSKQHYQSYAFVRNTSLMNLRTSTDYDKMRPMKQKSSAGSDVSRSIKVLVLSVLCLQNSLYTVFRRYSLGVLKENYSKYEILLVAEIIKFLFSAFMVSRSSEYNKLLTHIIHLIKSSGKMFFLACLYGSMNILSFIALREIGAGLFTIFAQLKIFSTALFSAIILDRKYSATRIRALTELLFGALLFSSNVLGDTDKLTQDKLLGIGAVVMEVITSGFASIYFEKVLKTDQMKFNIWERNCQLAFNSVPIYICFILFGDGGEAGYFGGWTKLSVLLSLLGSAGGLLVALSIKYADAILKTLATTLAIIISSLLDYFFLNGDLTYTMILSGGIVILAICNYSFDAATTESQLTKNVVGSTHSRNDDSDRSKEMKPLITV